MATDAALLDVHGALFSVHRVHMCTSARVQDAQHGLHFNVVGLDSIKLPLRLDASRLPAASHGVCGYTLRIGPPLPFRAFLYGVCTLCTGLPLPSTAFLFEVFTLHMDHR